MALPVHIANEAGFTPILVETNIEYRRPLVLGDTVEIDLRISELNRLYAVMNFEFRKVDGVVVARGRQKGLFIDIERNRPRCLTEEERAAFAAFVSDQPPG